MGWSPATVFGSSKIAPMTEQLWFQAQTNCPYCGASGVLFRASINDGFTDYLYKCPACKRIGARPTKN